MSSGFYGGDEVGAIIFDIGSHSLRAGYAGEDLPKADIPTTVGVWEPEEDNTIDVENITKRYNIGTAAINVVKRGMNMSSCLLDGVIEDWDMFEELIDYTFKSGLRSNSEEHPLLMSEASWNLPKCREVLTELMFERFNLPAFYLAKSAQLAAFSCGRSVGVVLDSGATHTSAIPIVDGFVLTNSISRSPGLGGDLVSDWCRRLLETQHIEIVPRYMISKKEAVREKEKAKYTRYPSLPNVASSWHQYMVKDMIHDFKANVVQILELPFEKKKPVNVPPIHYEFPNGYHQDFGAERYRIPEVLFTRRVPNDDIMTVGASQLVSDAISKCDIDLRASMYSQVIVTGGNTLIQGYTERLSRDIITNGAPSLRLKILGTNSTVERKYGAWIGGSILASLGSFQQQWMSREEYGQYGPHLVEKRCP